MSLVPDINPEKRSKKTLGHGCYRDTEREMESGGFDDTADYQFDQEVYRGCTNDLASPAAEIRGCSVYKGPTIRWVDFAMTLSAPLPGTNGKSRPDRRILHTYTSIQCNTASAPKPLEEIRDWRLFYPPLATYYDQEQMECPMFLFDTTLSLMDDFPMVPGRRPSLSIDLSVHFTEGTNFDDWQSSPSFYENGKPVDLAKYYRESEKCQESDLSRESGAYNNLWSNLKCSQIEGTADLKLNEISLKSAWWVDVFYNMVRKNYEVRESGDPQAIKQEEEHAHRYLQELSVMHEIRATPRAYPARPQRMAVLLWKFGKSKKGETATTSWRRLTPPLSPFQIQSPSPSLSQPPMTLDMALDGAQVRRSAPSYAEYYNLEPSIFSNNPQHLPTTPSLSEEGSSSTTPTADSRSLLSSTSTSFPSSISNSAYAPTNNVLLLPIHNSSQESSSHSQHSVYHSSLESFDSQQSELYQYQNSDIVAHSQSYERHGFSTNSQDTIGSSDIYHSQDAAYHQAEIPLYEYPVPHPDTLATASPSDDFTGGEIQLSFAHAPLMVPRANFVPQHQLIQRPEDFDHEYLDQSHHDGRGPDRQRQQHMHEHSAEQPLLRPYELNGYTIDYDGWEETLQLHPEMERHLGHIVEGDLGQVGDHYNTPERRQQHEEVEGEVSILRQVDVLGEDQDDDTPPERRLEYQ